MEHEASDTESITSSASGSTSASTEVLKPLPGAKSKVWKYFGFVANESGAIVSKARVKCTLCKQDINFCGNTTNLNYHLERNHYKQFTECCSVKQGSAKTAAASRNKDQPAITECFARKTPYKRGSKRYETCENALVEFICQDFQPISIVESKGFLNYSQTLDPLYHPASRTHFSRIAIPSKYEKVKDTVMTFVDAAEYISFTTDLWTGCHSRAYISVTIHYLTPDMKIHHHCITTREISVAHTAENLANEIEVVLDQWGIRDRIYGATTDNAQNIRNAIVDVMELYHLGCIGHTLQLSVNKSFKLTPVARLLGRVKKLVEHFKRSTKETYLLRDKQILLDLPQHELIQQCDTRWNSTLYMLQRVKEQQPALCSVLFESRDKAVRSLFPDGSEWNLLEDLVAVLEPFEEATKAMSGSNYPTISMISPLLYQVCKVTLKVKEDDNANLKRIKETMLEDFQDRYSSPGILEIINIAAFLDPRFKELDPFIPASERVDVKENVKLRLLMFARGTTEENGTPDCPETPTPDNIELIEENLSAPSSKNLGQ